jgi:hypothetical protein
VEVNNTERVVLIHMCIYMCTLVFIQRDDKTPRMKLHCSSRLNVMCRIRSENLISYYYKMILPKF